jgi:hypothetical protein
MVNPIHFTRALDACIVYLFLFVCYCWLVGLVGWFGHECPQITAGSEEQIQVRCSNEPNALLRASVAETRHCYPRMHASAHVLALRALNCMLSHAGGH